MKARYAFLIVGLVAMPPAAKAQPISGPYITLGGGVGFTDDTSKAFTYHPGINISNGPYAVTLKQGYAVSGAVGYGIGDGMFRGFRFELEGAYRSNPLNTLSTPNGLFKFAGDDTKTSAILNLMYDINLGLPVYPYLGVGAGVAVNSWSNVTTTNQHTIFGPVRTDLIAKEFTNASATALAAQFTAGVAYPISAVPGLSLTLDYKLFALPTQRTFNDRATITCGGAVCLGIPTTIAPGASRYNSEITNSIMLGVRYAFARPPAPTAAAVAAAVVPSPISRSYLVFFDWDKATLTDRARQIVAEAARNSIKVQYTRLEVNGYTDTSGKPKYNQGLSIRRAEAVASELVNDGVSKSAISIQGFGETHPLVPTADGLREPQNRRVEIIIK